MPSNNTTNQSARRASARRFPQRLAAGGTDGRQVDLIANVDAREPGARNLDVTAGETALPLMHRGAGSTAYPCGQAMARRTTCATPTLTPGRVSAREATKAASTGPGPIENQRSSPRLNRWEQSPPTARTALARGFFIPDIEAQAAAARNEQATHPGLVLWLLPVLIVLTPFYLAGCAFMAICNAWERACDEATEAGAIRQSHSPSEVKA